MIRVACCVGRVCGVFSGQDRGSVVRSAWCVNGLRTTPSLKRRNSQFAIRPTHCSLLILFALTFLLATPSFVLAHDGAPHSSNDILPLIGFDQNLQKRVPTQTPFVDEDGRSVRLGDFIGARPVILVLGYFECPNLCSLTRMGLVDALRQIKFDAGRDFDVVLISIDPTETPSTARRVKDETLAAYGRPETAAGWRFLTGTHEDIDAVADAVGFRYAYDEGQGQFAHASGLVLLTPEGRVARYFFALEFEPRDLRLGLVEAAKERIGSPVDQLLLLCYHYNPVTGKYTADIMTILRVAGLVTVLGMAGALFWMLRREKNDVAIPPLS